MHFIYFTAIDKSAKVINKPYNITTDIGLPVTLTCCVEGDPDHYYVGWMSRNSVIKAGEEHSISASPNFKSAANGTIHHLTIHSVKKAGKYECKVYTITGDVQDQVTHHVIVNGRDDGKDNAIKLCSSSSKIKFVVTGLVCMHACMCVILYACMQCVCVHKVMNVALTAKLNL